MSERIVNIHQIAPDTQTFQCRRRSTHRCLINSKRSMKSAYHPEPGASAQSSDRDFYRKSFFPRCFMLSLGADWGFEVCYKFYIRFYHSFIFYVWVSLLSLGTGIDAEWCRRDGSERQHDSLVLKWNIFSDSFFSYILCCSISPHHTSPSFNLNHDKAYK